MRATLEINGLNQKHMAQRPKSLFFSLKNGKLF